MKLTSLAGALATVALLAGCGITHHTTAPAAHAPGRPHRGRPGSRPGRRPVAALAHLPRRTGPGHLQPGRRCPGLRPGHREPGHHRRQPPGLRSRRPHRPHRGPHHPREPGPAPRRPPGRLREHAERLHHRRQHAPARRPLRHHPPGLHRLVHRAPRLQHHRRLTNSPSQPKPPPQSANHSAAPPSGCPRSVPLSRGHPDARSAGSCPGGHLRRSAGQVGNISNSLGVSSRKCQGQLLESY